MRRNALERLATLLLAAAAVLSCGATARAQPPATESQARYYVYGAFLTHAVPEIMGERVVLGPELEQRLGVASGADRKLIYDALMSYTDTRPLSVRRATADEIARYRPQARRELKGPLFTVQAGEVALLVEYDLQANAIPFVGQLGVAYQPPRPPVVQQRSAPPVAVVVPKPAPRVAPPPPPAAEMLKPNGPCVVKPVMSEQDLANCRPARTTAATPAVVPPPPPPVVKPQARVAPPPPPPPPQRTGPCEVKPVMSEEDLANCRAAPGGAMRIDPGPPPAAQPQARVQPAQPQRPAATPCIIKPVMSEEELIACRR